jgi:putative secretion ATPase (PEP-CTERM system associated)
MYEEYFGMNQKPFDLVPNPEFLYPSKSHLRVMQYIDYGIRERAGFILLTGSVGSGKTTLIRDMLKKYSDKNVIANVFNTKVNSEQLIAMVNDDFELDVEGKNKAYLLKDLNDFLIEKYSQGLNPILVIDEAQNLQPDLLEEVRMLSNLETVDSKLLQIVLVGQPELRDTLSIPELRQLRQRIGISCHISPLMRQEVNDYILHRLEVAGNREAVTLSEDVLDNVYIFSCGIPRLINILCDFLLLSAFMDGTRDITVSMVEDIAEELEASNRYWKGERSSGYKSVETGIRRETDNITYEIEGAMVSGNISFGMRAELFNRLAKAEKRISEIQEGQMSCLKEREIILKEIQLVKKINQELVSNILELKEIFMKEHFLLK